MALDPGIARSRKRVRIFRGATAILQYLSDPNSARCPIPIRNIHPTRAEALVSMSIGHCLVTAVPAMFASTANSAWTTNMPVGVTDMSREIHGLHMLIFWVCVLIAVMVFGILIYSIFTFRKSRAAIADRTLTHSTKVEVIWTVIPIMILIAMAIPATETLIGIEDMRNSDLTIKVTGYQWKWQYDYLDHGVSFFSGLARDSNAARQLNSGAELFARDRQPSRRAGERQGASAVDGCRCHSCLVGAGLRRQEGRNSRICE